jgi:hypothetical protein
MTNTLALQEWLDVIREEYLSEFVKDGGSSIKFAVPLGGVDCRHPISGLANMASEMDYIVAKVDASDTRVHMAEDIFFKVASQVPWRPLARRVVLRLARESGYATDGINSESEGSLLRSIGSANSSAGEPLNDEFILQELRPKLYSAVMSNRSMAKDFRVAMTHLCLAEARDTSETQEESTIIDWLTGVNRRISAVRSYSIYNGINRTNARHLLESLLHWTKFAGRAGVVMLIDDSRVTLRRNPRDGLRFYSRAAVMDHYELLREFIDSTDRLESLLMIVLAEEDFLNDGLSGKGMGIYQALRGRIFDEVYARSQANPMSALVRLMN